MLLKTKMKEHKYGFTYQTLHKTCKRTEKAIPEKGTRTNQTNKQTNPPGKHPTYTVGSEMGKMRANLTSISTDISECLIAILINFMCYMSEQYMHQAKNSPYISNKTKK